MIATSVACTIFRVPAKNTLDDALAGPHQFYIIANVSRGGRYSLRRVFIIALDVPHVIED